MTISILQGDVVERLRELQDKCVQCVVTSPPYYGLRDYQVEGQIGLEDTPELYVKKMVGVFREVWRVLRDDGTLWLNIGDSYASSPIGKFNGGSEIFHGRDMTGHSSCGMFDKLKASGLKPKDMIGIPWKVAFALQADGWYLRSDIIWSKPNPMPESVTDRPTKSHEYIFLLTKNARYFYDSDAIREPATESSIARISQPTFDLQTGGDKDYGKTGVNPNRSMRKCIENFKHKNLMEDGQTPQTMHLNRVLLKQDQTGNPTYTGFNERWKAKGQGDLINSYPHSGNVKSDGTPVGDGITRNARTVWTITTQARPEAHFATFPDEIPRRCIKAGTSERGCCPKCGAPWERQLKPSEQYAKMLGEDWLDKKNHPKEEVMQKGMSMHKELHRTTADYQTIGWQPTCKCGISETVPCTVLDPFMGSGTTLKVARDLKRDAIGIEINPVYVKIAKRRLRLDEQLVSD